MQRASTEDVGALAEALEQDPDDGSRERCWKALARVVDDAPTYVWQEGDSNGMTVRAMLLTGPFVGAEVVAMVACPLGGALEVSPFRKGQRILVDMLDGRPDGICVATASVPGGKEDPIPSAIAGVPLDSEGLENQADPTQNNASRPRAILFAPPKGIGHREYYRGAIKVIRLKGKQDDFFSGFVVSADDGASIEMRWNSLEQSYLVEMKDATGVRLSVGGGIVSMSDADGTAFVQVSKGKVFIQADEVTINGNTCARVDGGFVLLGMGVVPPVPTGPNACAIGVAGPVNVISSKVYVGL